MSFNRDERIFSESAVHNMLHGSVTLHVAYLCFHGARPLELPPGEIYDPITRAASDFRTCQGVGHQWDAELP